jgi:hypothetical protein
MAGIAGTPYGDVRTFGEQYGVLIGRSDAPASTDDGGLSQAELSLDALGPGRCLAGLAWRPMS